MNHVGTAAPGCRAEQGPQVCTQVANGVPSRDFESRLFQLSPNFFKVLV